jgi:hypothetical protein
MVHTGNAKAKELKALCNVFFGFALFNLGGTKLKVGKVDVVDGRCRK